MQLLDNLFKVGSKQNADMMCYMLTSLVFCNNEMSKNPRNQ